ncbi:MarR family transcriptional regulator [Longispora fulva]|uniref:DNA-binding MarR family transcriptional regulator n=1 Tax=Longispora fulva TaxID=619741 RepID=A0A8J7KL58_9ACTN|nr:MarR family transcriptional regulator [Longispora fulva]MBG6137556.1 DNA-binding MarR family transcriptional regulator [Longispora fulva]GIG61090.1 MarR family transcriptional regulator [Longispora fulva]
MTDPVTSEVVRLIAQIVAMYTKEYETAAGARDLTTIQAKVLVMLAEPMAMREIADRLGSERSNVTGIIDRLEARGLVERRADPVDRRVKKVARTAGGEALATGFAAELRFAAAPLAGLSVTDRTQLRDLLRQVAGTDLS